VSTDDIETLVEDLREVGRGRVVALAGDLAEPSTGEDLIAKAHEAEARQSTFSDRAFGP
jgi:hypothetical protein